MFANLKIGSRLFLGFGLVLALLCIMAGVAAWQQGRLADAAAYYAENLVPSYEAEHEVALALSDIRRFELRHVLTNSDDGMDALEGKIAERRKLIADRLDRYAQVLVSDDQDKRALEQVQQALAAYYAEWEKTRPLSRKTVTDPTMTAAATEQLLGASSKNYEATHEAIRRWWDYNVKLSKDQMEQAQSVANSAKAVLGALTLAALVLGAAAAVLITRSIVRPIQQAVQLASTVADGDLTMRIEAHGKDEVAQLLQALSRMNDNLAGIVNRVRNSSDSIATGSTQIASGNADLSQRTEEQASNLQQTAASMEQLSGTVRSNAETAGHANELAAQASAAAVKGGEVVGSVVATMQDIANASKKISDIIGAIDGIAFQTNILALNAAVEAARAGEQGRGFAVVASEVRSLASRAADAAKEIKSLIGASVEKVEMGARQVHEAGSSMDEIVSQVQRVTAMISEISAATNEQSAGISQVGDAVTQLDQVTQQNAALVEESAAAAESLRHQAAQLTEVVGVFKVLQSADDMGHARSTAANAAVIERRSASRPFTGAAAASKAAAPVQTAAKTGTDNWETF